MDSVANVSSESEKEVQGQFLLTSKLARHFTLLTLNEKKTRDQSSHKDKECKEY